MTNFFKMIQIFSSFILICLLSFCKKSTSGDAANQPPSNPPADTSTYKLIWSDEFDKATIDTSVWNFEIDGNGGGNHEQEYYQRNNATIENGNLIITAKKETCWLK